MDHPASIFRGARVDFYGTLVDADSIWQDHDQDGDKEDDEEETHGFDIYEQHI